MCGGPIVACTHCKFNLLSTVCSQFPHQSPFGCQPGVDQTHDFSQESYAYTKVMSMLCKLLKITVHVLKIRGSGIRTTTAGATAEAAESRAFGGGLNAHHQLNDDSSTKMRYTPSVEVCQTAQSNVRHDQGIPRNNLHTTYEHQCPPSFGSSQLFFYQCPKHSQCSLIANAIDYVSQLTP